MANTASAIKRVRSNNRKRVRNKITRSTTRTAVRLAREATPEEAKAATLAAISALDRAAKAGRAVLGGWQGKQVELANAREGSGTQWLICCR